MKVMSKNIRECIWPLLEPLEEIKPKEVKVEDCNWKENDIDLMLNYIEKYSASEDSRKSQVESKATVFIGIFGVVITVLLNLVKDIIVKDTSSTNNGIKIAIVLVIIPAIIYLCRAIWFSIKTLERRRYYSFGFPDFMFIDSEIKKKQIIVKQYNDIKKNQLEINLKVDYMTMAQEYFKRAIIVVSVFSILIFVIEVILINFNIIGVINNFNINWIWGISILILYILVINIYKKLR